MARLGRTDLRPYPVCLGGNVFGWTADEETSFAILDGYRAAGGNFIDTSDVYSSGGPGSSGGESEAIIGRWMRSRGCRDEMIVATKVGADVRLSLAPGVIREAIEASLERLQTDYVDIYYAHLDDAGTPLEESLDSFAALVGAGLVRYLGGCNYSPARLREAIALSPEPWVVVSYRYNLLERAGYENALRGICAGAGIDCLPYWGLARGFLTGKYRPGAPAVDSVRAHEAAGYLDDPRAVPLLDELDAIAAAHAVPVAAVALAWLRAQPTTTSPVASARTTEQLDAIVAAAELALEPDELERLDAITEPEGDEETWAAPLPPRRWTSSSIPSPRR